MSLFSVFNPAKIEIASVTDEVYPSSYEVQGAGSAIVNGTYTFEGICNDRPYYKHETGSAFIWYFSTSAFPSSMWCGWYISKEVNTSAVSASSDYYSAYVHSKLPPAASGWVTRAPGMSLTAGCGHNPPPSILEPLDTKSSPSKNDSRVVQFHKAESLVAEGAGCTEVFYRLVHVTGAGKELANGVYEFAGEMNHRPYYLKQLRGWTARGMSEDAAEGAEDDGTSSKGISSKDSSQREALWYFSDCPLNKSTSGLVSYNGWYLSKNIDTSSFSAGLDMYSCYVHSALPPMQGGWIARLPGLPPTAGCGKNPPPRVKYITTPLSAGSDADEMEDDATTSYLVQLLRIMLPSGQTISIDVCEHHTVGDVIIKLERHIHLLMRVCTPVYDIKLHCREAELKVYSKAVFACGIMKGDILVASFSPRKPLSVTHNISKRVQIIGAGPVGLWLAIHIKSYCPTWIVTCYERRLSYTRSHALRLDLQAFENMIAWVAGRPGAAELNMCQEKWFPRTRTAIVEEDLRLLAQSIGVSILYDTELNMQTILDQRQDRADIVICCDGARSGCRKELVALQDGKMRRELRGQMQLGSLLQVKFDALGEVKTSKGTLAQFLQNVSLQEHFFSVLCGNYDAVGCTTPVTIFALINDEVAQDIQSTPSSLQALDPTCSQIRTELGKLLDQICPAGIKPASLTVSVLPVAYSIAQQLCYTLPAHCGAEAECTQVYLAGDAAMGLPLEKGLNFGWRIASRLAAYITHIQDPVYVRKAYSAYFDTMSAQAVQYVNEAYSKYMSDIQTASFVRNFVRPFVLSR